MLRSETTAKLALAVLVLLGSAATVLAAGDPNGTWTWTRAGRGGRGGGEVTMVLKVEGEKLTGTVDLGMIGKADIKNGTIKGDELSFETVLDVRGNQITTKYNGKIDGDTIKGKSETAGGGGRGGRGGPQGPQDWEAKRKK